MTSAFQRVHPSMSEGREASPVVNERGHQEAIKMAAEVRDWTKGNHVWMVVETLPKDSKS